MRLEETAMDNLKRMATDILCCPVCMSEDLEEVGLEYDEVEDFITWHMRCRDCEKLFTDTST